MKTWRAMILAVAWFGVEANLRGGNEAADEDNMATEMLRLPDQTNVVSSEQERNLQGGTTCPTMISFLYATGSAVPCATNADCEGIQPNDGVVGCCIHPFCICGSNEPGANRVTCVDDPPTTAPTAAPSVPSAGTPSAPTAVPTSVPTTAPIAAPTNITLAPIIPPVAAPVYPTRIVGNETTAPVAVPESEAPVESNERKIFGGETAPTVVPLNTTLAPILATLAPIVPATEAPVEPTAAPTDKRTCPTSSSALYQSRGNSVVPCVINADCEGFIPSDGLQPCCLHPFCICGSKNPGSRRVACVSD